MSDFNRALLGKNIKYLAAGKNIKVGDLEKEAGVSTGYFSRLANEEGKGGSTLVDIICKVAEKLDTSVNTLISTDMAALTPNETLLSAFFDKLSKDTAEGTITWDLESEKQLRNPEYQAKHPLFRNYGSAEFPDMRYYSLFDSDIQIAGDSYRVAVVGRTLYLMETLNPESASVGYELYLLTTWQNGMIYYKDYPEKICKAYPESDLYVQIDDLHNAAAESSRHVKLSDSVIGAINSYIHPKEEV